MQDIRAMLSLHKQIDRDIAWLSLGVVGFALVVVTVSGIAYGQVISVSVKPATQLSSESVDQQVPPSPKASEGRGSESVAPVEYKIEILNASGVKGAANVAKNELEGKISDATLVITTGNVDYQTGTSLNYQSTELSQSKLAEQLLVIWPKLKWW